MPEKIEVKEQKAYHPKCPHCEKALDRVYFHKVKISGGSGLGYVVVYSCPHCKKSVGTSASNG